MNRMEDKNTRYYIDVDLTKQKILGWDYGQKQTLIRVKMSDPHLHRIFISKGQFNKLRKKQEAIE